MKDKIFIGIIAVLLLILVFQKKHVKEIIRQVEDTHKIDSLNNINKLKQDSINQLSNYIEQLNEYNDVLKEDLNDNIAELKRLKNAKRKKDSTINSSSVSELQTILTERYNKN